MATDLNVFSCSFLLLLCVSACMGLEVWCVVKEDASEAFMRDYLDTACQEVDCSAVQPGGDCFLPNTLTNHVSYVLNLKYRVSRTCVKYLGNLVDTDPSYDKCKYT